MGFLFGYIEISIILKLAQNDYVMIEGYVSACMRDIQQANKRICVHA